VESNSGRTKDLMPVYVQNIDSHKKEYQILKRSNLYRLVSDSTESIAQIELEDLINNPIGCITPQFTVTVFTLGFYPVRYTEKYKFQYQIISNDGSIVIHRNDLEIEKVVSWFHLFSPLKNRNRALGKVLCRTK
jgi:hypothetical protein